MALTAKFYSFQKRKNSTKQPTGASSDFNIVLKGGSSLLTPTFLLEIGSRPAFNYLQFEDKYYYISDIVSVRNNLWEISCVEDVLATHKTEIGNTSAIILYATGGRNDIIDTRIEIDSSVSTNTSEQPVNGFTINQIAAGSVILSVTGIGSFGNYMLQTYADMYHMIEDVSGFWGSLGITSVEDALQQFFYGGNIADCLKGAIALPFDMPYSSYNANFGPQEQLYLGSYPCTNGGNPIFVHRVNNPIYKATTTISIPWQVNDWRRHSPYTTLQLYLPLIGTMNLNSDELVGFSSLDITYSLNIASGDLAVEVSTDSPIKIIATASNNVAMSLPFGSANISPTKVMASGMTAIAGIATGIATGVAGKGATAALGAAGSGMAMGASQLLGAGTQSGGGGLSGGASQGLFKNIKLIAVTRHLTDTQANLDPIIGKPVMAKHTINTYSGFVQTDGMCVNGAMTESEYNEINAQCNKGIYFE